VTTPEDYLSATRTIPAPRAAIWAVVAHPRGHVAIDSSGMLMSSDATAELSAVGDEFVIHMDREALGDFPLGKYDVTNVVTKLDRGRLLEWTVTGKGFPRIGHVYGYTLEDAAEGMTTVTSYYDWSGISEELRASGIFPVIPATALKATLGILERVVCGGGLAPV
jgi:hypothetical protein